MKIVAVIPIKFNNRRLPGKNIRPFTGGKPLCQYVFSTAMDIKQFDAVYVYCSDDRVKEYMLPGMKFLRRSEKFDADSAVINDLLKAFAEEVPADIYTLMHVTAPFIKPSTVEKGIAAVASGEYDSAFSVQGMQEFLWQDGKPLNYNPIFVPRTQDLPKIYKETSAFFVYNKDVIKSGRRIGDKPFMVETGETESIDIDNEEDFMIADAVFSCIVKPHGGGKDSL